MRYEIEFRPKALRDLKHLTPQISRRIEKKLDAICDDMTGDVKRLVDYSPGWRLRVGGWLVLFEPQGKRLIVHRIVYRSEAYERR